MFYRFSSQNEGSLLVPGVLVLQGIVLLIILNSGSQLLRTQAARKISIPLPALETLAVHTGPITGEPPLPSIPETSTPKEQLRTVQAKVVKHDSLMRLWVRHGGSYPDGIQAAKAFKQAGVPVSDLQLGEIIELDISPSNGIVGLRRKLSEGRQLTLQKKSDATYSANVFKPRIIETEVTIGGTIKSNFAEAAAQADVPSTLLDEFVDLFSGTVEFRKDFQPGDSFALVYTGRSTEAGHVLEPGAIKAASLKVGEKFFAVVRYAGKDGKARYYDASGNPIGSYFLRYPVQFSRISSVFTDSRLHPILKIRRPHRGVDFSAPIGTPVRAVADGVISVAGYRKDAGLMVEVKHGSRYATDYLHLSKLAPGVRKGAHVSRGQVIGAVGMTGLTSGAHLHFSFYDRGVYVDPLKVNLPAIVPGDARVPQRYLKNVVAKLRHQHGLRPVAAAALDAPKRPRA